MISNLLLGNNSWEGRRLVSLPLKGRVVVEASVNNNDLRIAL